MLAENCWVVRVVCRRRGRAVAHSASDSGAPLLCFEFSLFDYGNFTCIRRFVLTRRWRNEVPLAANARGYEPDHSDSVNLQLRLEPLFVNSIANSRTQYAGVVALRFSSRFINTSRETDGQQVVRRDRLPNL